MHPLVVAVPSREMEIAFRQDKGARSMGVFTPQSDACFTLRAGHTLKYNAAKRDGGASRRPSLFFFTRLSSSPLFCDRADKNFYLAVHAPVP